MRMKRKYYKLSLLLCFVLNNFNFVFAERYTTESVLNNGRWMKFGIETTGIYKITYSDLEKLGFNPERVSVWGYGGEILEENFDNVYSKGRYMDDLPQVAVWRGNGYLLFYGKGVTKWTYRDEATKKSFIHENNPYSTKGYYFITDQYEPKSIETIPYENITGLRIEKYDDYYLHEKDVLSINKSGRELFGESLNGSGVQIPSITISGITDDPCKVEFRAVARLNNSKETVLSINGTEVCSGTIISDTDSYQKAKSVEAFGEYSGNKTDGMRFTVKLDGGNYENAHLDYIRLSFKRELKFSDASFFMFRNISSKGNDACFKIKNATTKSLILDVTEAENMKIVETRLDGTELSFQAHSNNVLKEYAAVQTDKSIAQIDIKSFEEVKNQNLHSLSQQDMIIISPDDLIPAAQELAAFHIDEGLKVQVINPIHIYNEFSSGTPDATAYRRFMKMFYDRSRSDTEKPQYLLLFGDGSYDNRFITTDWTSKPDKKRFLLTYQTQESLGPTSHVVDDYFGFLTDNSGQNVRFDTVQLGIGRFPITSLTKAKEMVKKVIDYAGSTGKWKNRVAFVADDGNTSDNWDTEHQISADNLADVIEAKRPDYIVNKIFFDNYPRTLTGQSGYKGVTDRIKKLLDDGLFLINYIGHGDTQSWSEERVLTQNMINKMQYAYLPIWITTTCDFCRFDATATSAGESVFLNSKGGGIALFTTSRVTYHPSNYNLNRSIIDILFSEKRNYNLRLGDVIRQAKHENIDGKGRGQQFGFCLIGDPALKIYYPQNVAEIQTINDIPVSDDALFQFKARENIAIEGTITNSTGAVNSEFNGVIDFVIMDNRDTFETRGNNKATITGLNGKKEEVIRKIKYVDYKSMISSSLMTQVVDGHFRLEFEMPEDISYSDINPDKSPRFTNGKISMHAYHTDNIQEASGSFSNYKAGGTADEYSTDDDGPEIRKIYLNDSTFVDGDKVNETPYFVAYVWDKSGINTSGNSVGHDIILRTSNTFHTFYNLNNYYTPIFENKGEGIIQFSIPKLLPGMYTAEFLIWDIRGNSSVKEFSFEVVEGLKPNLYEIIASPNPAREYVHFRLSHNRPKSDLRATVYVYDLKGSMIWVKSVEGSSELFKDFVVEWNLLDMNNSRVKPGVYIYRADISSNKSREATKAQKIVILRE